ncbi:MAG: hypothetical protein U5M53_13725 [Rhodoferax sp.]|nr:hypothetical protein [Rhodoferax sp.]
MKASAVSGDLLVKIALGAAVLGVGYFALRKVTGAAGGAAAATVDAINPASNTNLVNRAVTAVGGAIVSDTGPGRNADGSWTLGGWLYDITHDDPLAPGASSTVYGSTTLSTAAAADARREYGYTDPRRVDLQTDTGTSWDSTPGIY